MSDLLERVLDAHGGLSRWRGLSAISGRVRFGGLAFLARLRFATGRWRGIEADPHRPRVTFGDYPSASLRGHFEGDRVWLTDREGAELESRADARAVMGTWRRQLRWDSLDLLYFAGYAVWNYLTTPFLLASPGVGCEEGAPWVGPSESLRTLDVRFPSGVPTHSPAQRFYFDERFLLRRHDYDPLPFASWAHAAHLCEGHRDFDGVRLATRRRVVPRRPDGDFRPGPTLVWIEFDGFEFR